MLFNFPSVKQLSKKASSTATDKKPFWIRACLAVIFVSFAATVIAVLLGLFALLIAYPNLPSIDTIIEYRPKIPLRIYSSEGLLIGEFGEERRNLTKIEDIPNVMKQAVLSIEDESFYQHGGVDYKGILRAGILNLTNGKIKQGASTITQQVARNFYLSSEQSYTRKIYEILLSFKIESQLTKDQILEVYMNQIYLGQRAYGFASAAQIYFGKSLKEINTAEAAMLAGLPKAPSAYNPIVNPQRARQRQQYILLRMHELGYISENEYEQARNAEIKIRTVGTEFNLHAEYVAEMVRQMLYQQFKEEIYTRGLNVYTTISKDHQESAYQAVRRGVMDYEKRHGYRGPEAYVEIPNDIDEQQQVIDDALLEHPDSDDIYAGLVLQASPKEVRIIRQTGEVVTIQGDALKTVATSLNSNAQPSLHIRRGSIIRLIKGDKGIWEITQLPEVESAFVSMSPQDGSVKALIGGFDFNRNKFNHANMAWRQPGSSFKPFIYSASLEKGLTPATIINDAPLIFDAAQTGGQPWEPKNYDGKFDGPLTMRRALAKSKNMVSIRILQKIGPNYGQEYITRFGFDSEKHPPYLTMALGAGSVTPMQLASAYSVFANGGYRVNPYIVSKVTDSQGNIIMQAQVAAAGDETFRVISARNAFTMDSLLKEVVKSGTAAKAMALKRNDLAGKTGTTNDSLDAWFAGYQPQLVGVAWIGFDTPKKLGDKETGGGLALPIWINYMAKVLKNYPDIERPVPEGIVNIGGEYYYEENTPGGAGGIRSLGLGDGTITDDSNTLPENGPDNNSTPVDANKAEEEKKRILDIFRN